jgi:hypothetical protein
MSTLRVNNITDNSGGTNNLNVPGTAKAWVNFNGTGTVAIRASFNVSSITDNGTGDYTVNFTTAMVDANYSAIGTCECAVGTSYAFVEMCFDRTNNLRVVPTTTAVRYASCNPAANGVDVQFNFVAIFR